MTMANYRLSDEAAFETLKHHSKDQRLRWPGHHG